MFVSAMGKSFLRLQSRRFCEHLMKYLMVELDEKDLERSAIVFSPHPDDVAHPGGNAPDHDRQLLDRVERLIDALEAAF